MGEENSLGQYSMMLVKTNSPFAFQSDVGMELFNRLEQ